VSDILYRDAIGADAKAVAAFASSNFVHTFGHLYPPEDLASFLAAKYSESIQSTEIANPLFRYHLALKDGVIVGYCMMGALEIDVDDPGALELHRLYVAPEMKGQGVAHALMQDCLAWARRLEATALYLSVWENNARAQAFYKRYGFTHVGEHKFMVGRVADRDFIWRLAL
jgi:ribosomal protein S18 acetylase RimI-like enzyme